MNKYIIEILKIQTSVILPGFGALMVASARTGKVVFNPHLKFNDGSLAKFISEKEGVDKQEAENQVAKWIREIEAELAKGNKFEIFDFGHFFTNKDGAVDFVMKDEASAKLASAEKPKVKEKETKVAKKEESPIKEDKPKKEEKSKKVEEKKKDAKKEEEKSTKNTLTPISEKKSAEPAPKVPEKKTEEIKKEVVDSKKVADKKVEEVKKEADKTIPLAAASITESKQDKNTFVPKKEELKTENTDPKKDDKAKTVIAAAASTKIDPKEKYRKSNKKAEKPVKEKKTKEKGEKKKRKVWPWILLLILAGGGTAGYMFRNEINEFLHTGVGDDTHLADDVTLHDETSDENATADVVVDENDTTTVGDEISTNEAVEDNTEVSTDNAVEEVIEEVVEEVIEEPIVATNNTSPGGSYHIIGNAFGERSNAEGYVNTMNGKGYSAQILGRFDGLYLVAIKSFDSREAANNGLSGVSGDASSAWVFKYSK